MTGEQEVSQQELVELLRHAVVDGEPLFAAAVDIRADRHSIFYPPGQLPADKRFDELLIDAAAEIAGISQFDLDAFVVWEAGFRAAMRVHSEWEAQRWQALRDGVRKLKAQAAAEGREVTDEEIDALKRSVVEAYRYD
jgi:hypothetical protein